MQSDPVADAKHGQESDQACAFDVPRSHAKTSEEVLNREGPMLWTEYPARAAVICLLLLALTLSGCGTIGGIIVGSIVSSHERAEDDSFCTKRCADLKGDDNIRSHRLCMSEERDRRSEIKDRGERHRKEMEKRLADEALEIPRK